MGGVDLDLERGDPCQSLGRGRLTPSLGAVPGVADPSSSALLSGKSAKPKLNDIGGWDHPCLSLVDSGWLRLTFTSVHLLIE